MQTLNLTKKYDKYSGYKDSGAGWLGKIPLGWKISKLKADFKLSTERLFNDRAVDSLLSVSGYRGIEKKNIDNLDGQMPSEDVSMYRIVRRGQLVVNTMWLNFTGLGVSDYEGYVSPAYRSYNISNEMVPKFVHYLLRSNAYVQKYSSLLYGIRPNSLQVKPYDFEKIEVLKPSASEQVKITNYLDEKTQLIDEIIEKKKKLIELLREKRTAVINQAVTKGLDQKTELVDSGVEWIGKIPNGWEIKKLKYVATIFPSNIDKLTTEGESMIRLCNYVDVYKNEKITKQMTEDLMIASASKKQIEKLSLLSDDVLITKDSETPDDIGIPAYVPENIEGVVCGYHLAIIRPNKIRGEYVFRFIQSQSTKIQFFLAANGLTRYALGIGDIGGLFLTIPTFDEQDGIKEFLNKKVKSFDDSLSKVRDSIELLQEFKSSLISNVVIGKVKIS